MDDFELVKLCEILTDPTTTIDEYLEYANKLGEWLEKQPKYEPEEFTFITKLKENKKWYYKKD